MCVFFYCIPSFVTSLMSHLEIEVFWTHLPNSPSKKESSFCNNQHFGALIVGNLFFITETSQFMSYEVVCLWIGLFWTNPNPKEKNSWIFFRLNKNQFKKEWEVSTRNWTFDRFPSGPAKIIKRVDLEIKISSPTLMVEQEFQGKVLCFHPVLMWQTYPWSGVYSIVTYSPYTLERKPKHNLQAVNCLEARR